MNNFIQHALYWYWNLVLTLFFTLIFRYVLRSKLTEDTNTFPTPKGLKYYPLLGHSLTFLGDTEYIFNTLLQVASNNNHPVRVQILHKTYYTVMHPHHMEVVLNSPKCLEKDALYKYTIPLIGYGLFNMPVGIWRVHRKHIMPTFNQKILDSFVDIFAEQSNLLAQILERKVGIYFDVEEYVAKCTLECVAQTAMGVTTNIQTSDCEIVEYVNKGMDLLTLRMYNVVHRSDLIFHLSKHGKQEEKVISGFYNFIQQIFKEKRELYREMLKQKHGEANIEEVSKRKAFLEYLMELSESEGKFTEDEIINEVQTFMIAGSDTSGTVVGFVLLCLGIYPEIQKKVYEEVFDILGRDRSLKSDDLPHLKYLEKVVKETMRLFPIGPFILRQVSEDLPLANKVLPKGSGVVLCIYSLHRSPEYYKDPLEFKPERFNPEESSKRHPYAYLAFSGGPRNCAGPKFGIMLVKTIVATLIRKYHVETTYKRHEDIRMKQSLLLKTVLGYPVKLIPRDN
ncbi:PREDICTED: cytochrome P450 4C1-like [Nicrophorus vespilloides]|uniref:Cytochrome P450 4C1-like n=1 Tax=Nicrophorus vespilloides TaxID=110193 RepID=A0ABM1MUG9_NICVS|nr:PREDICTED: cytochrome P450 4C1-like [Nicrophorus vespilloides]